MGGGRLAGGPVMKNLPANARDIGRLRLDPCVRKIPWSRAWQTTPVFLPRESHGQRSLAGQGLWGCKELNMTLRLNNSVQQSDSVTFFIFFFIMVYYRILNMFSVLYSGTLLFICPLYKILHPLTFHSIPLPHPSPTSLFCLSLSVFVS